MIFPIRTFMVMAAVCLLAAGPGQAERIYFQAHGGYSTFNLDDVNHSLDAVNEQAGGPFLDHINSGWDFGLSVGYTLTPELGLALGYARLSASSGFSQDGYLVEYDLPANLYGISLDYLPVTEKGLQFGAGTTLGLITSSASLRYDDPVSAEMMESFAGSGFHFSGYVLAALPVALNWSLIGQGGFRHALIGELKVDGETVYNPDSVDDKFQFNYSGLFLRVGVKFQP
jgi:hypothetical protein